MLECWYSLFVDFMIISRRSRILVALFMIVDVIMALLNNFSQYACSWVTDVRRISAKLICPPLSCSELLLPYLWSLIYWKHTAVLWPFFRDHLGESVTEENFWTLWCKWRLTEADTLTIRLGATPSGLTNAHLHCPPYFLWVGCHSCHPTNSVSRKSTTNNSGGLEETSGHCQFSFYVIRSWFIQFVDFCSI